MSSPADPTNPEAVALEALAALGQATRLRILRHLVTMAPDAVAAGAIADTFGCRQNTLSTHFGILSRAGLITRVREGRSILYAANFDGMRGLVNYLLEDCCAGRLEVCAPVFETLQESCGCRLAPASSAP